MGTRKNSTLSKFVSSFCSLLNRSKTGSCIVEGGTVLVPVDFIRLDGILSGEVCFCVSVSSPSYFSLFFHFHFL